MPKTRFNVGDKVRLKSGGPVMTVEHPGDGPGDDYAVCTWFDKNDTRQQSPFNSDALELVVGK